MPTQSEQIATLIASNEALQTFFQNRRAEIDAAVAAALAAAPSTARTYYVDQQTGDDTATGLVGGPLASIEQACSRTPAGGYCRVYLLSDYVFDRNELIEGIYLQILPSGAARRTMSFASFVDGATRRVGGVELTNNSAVSIAYVDLTVTADEADISASEAPFASRSTAATITVALEIYDSVITVPASFPGAILGPALLTDLQVANITGALAGKWISGVAAGTSAANVTTTRTNLSTL